MKRTLNVEAIEEVGKKIKVCGWAQSIRCHGRLIFVDLRDRSGLLQIVFAEGLKSKVKSQKSEPQVKSQNLEMYELAQSLRPEWVIEAEGIIGKRPKGMINPEIESGEVELQAKELKVLNKSKTTPFEIDIDSRAVGEEKRLKYRYLDLRTERMRNNLVMRHKVVKFMRDFMDKEGFIEIETPLLTKSTPEGSRDFIVPSRLHAGKFYALPQSPQQYKQLLMAAGIEKYFQIARCLRDEDLRGDRQPEHTQLDIEMSFVEQEDVMELVERLLIEIVEKLYPKKKIQKIPFPRLSFAEAMKKYGTDKPDLRIKKSNLDELAFCWVKDFPFFEKAEQGGWTFTHNPFSAPKPEFIKDLLLKKNIDKILTTQYDIVLNGSEVGGGSIRNHQPEPLQAVFEILGYGREKMREGFGHMLRAFEYGCPPHGGAAPGIDRLVSILQGEPNIREVIAFPKTGDGRELMMGTPSEVSKAQLDELRIQALKKPKTKKQI